MNRRSFIQGIIGATAGAFIVPEIIVPERRFWSLDRTMLKDEWITSGWFVPKNEDKAIVWTHSVTLVGIAEPESGWDISPPSQREWGAMDPIRVQDTRAGHVFRFDGIDGIFWHSGQGIVRCG